MAEFVFYHVGQKVTDRLGTRYALMAGESEHVVAPRTSLGCDADFGHRTLEISIMRIAHFALVTTTALLAACASDGSTAPSQKTPGIESRLAAVAAAPIVSLSDASVTMMVAVTSSLNEVVSGGVCAQVIEARLPAGTSWTDVTSTSSVCSMLAAQLMPGATLNISAIADQPKIRAVAGSGASIVLRVRHSLSGASASYMLQSNEITWRVP